MTGDVLQADVLVVGGGMAGMSAALVAAGRGKAVIVVDAAAAPGGSARLSGGIVWAPLSVDAYSDLDPGVDPELIRIVVDGFGPAVESVRALGLDVQAEMRLDRALGFPAVAHQIDLLGYLDRARAEVVAHDGYVVTSAHVLELLVEGGDVIGARVSDRDGEVAIAAGATILATGGFQGSRDLRRTYLGDAGAELLLRSNPTSDGAGLRLATAIGAAVERSSDRFYGNLLPVGMPRPLRESDFLRLSQFHSVHSLILDRDGKRLGDESVAYYENAWLVSRARHGRGLLIGDRRTRDFGNGLMGFDRVAECRDAGAHVIEADRIDALAAGAADWGYAGVAEAVAEYNDRLETDPDGLEPPRRHRRDPLDAPPFFAVEVAAGITFPFCGLKIDSDARVLAEGGGPIANLYAAGADASVFHTLYGGGLAMAMTTGRLAASAASGGPSRAKQPEG